MNIFLTGSSGFIGSALATALVAAGNTVSCGGRSHAGVKRCVACHHWQPTDFSVDHSVDVWKPRLKEIDIVINTVGIIREHGSQTFDALHYRAPVALFEAAAQMGVRRIIQLSALGASPQASSHYYRSKAAADAFLATLACEWIILQPSLVYGAGGNSAKLFALLASLPVIPVPASPYGREDALIQPVHLDDLIAAMMALVESPEPLRRRVEIVGPVALSLTEFLLTLRHSMRMSRGRIFRVPVLFMSSAARIGALLPRSLLDKETLDMLLAGNTGDVAQTRQVLGREPRRPEAFISNPQEQRIAAMLGWLLPLLRYSVGTVWIVTGIVSIFFYPAADSYGLLVRAGVPAALAPMALHLAAMLDFILGVATFVVARRRALWWVQIVVILAYTLVITIQLPEFWAHPYGPILKNLPMLAAILMLHQLEKR